MHKGEKERALSTRCTCVAACMHVLWCGHIDWKCVSRQGRECGPSPFEAHSRQPAAL